MKKFLAIISLVLVTGCASSLIPEKRTESVKATESIANAQNLMVEKTLTPVFQRDGIPMAESIKLSHSSSQDAGAAEKASGSLSPSLIGLLVALILALCFAAWTFIAISKTTRLGSAADGALGAITDQVTTIVATVSDEAVKAQLLNVINKIEKERGKLTRK